MVELHAIFTGRVQGIGFRWTVVDHAECLHITGMTKNLSNGAVGVYAQGSKEQLEAFLAAVQENPGLARIDTVKATYHKPKTCYRGFSIDHE